jgi:hypothetical protein
MKLFRLSKILGTVICSAAVVFLGTHWKYLTLLIPQPVHAVVGQLNVYGGNGATYSGMLNVNSGSIYANSGTTDTVFNGNAAGNTTSSLIGPGGYWAIRTDTGYKFNLDVYNAGSPLTALTVGQNGYLGIKSAAPAEALQVNGSIRIPAATATDNNSPALKLNSGDDFLDNGVYLNQYAYGFHTNAQSGAAAPYISGWGGIDFYTGGAQKMTISQGGYVGVGTATPGDKLNISQTWFDNSSTDFGGGLRLTGNAPTLSFYDTDNTNNKWMIHNNGETLNFYRRPNGGSWDQMAYYDGSGNMIFNHAIGVGVSPTHIMDVSGNVAAKIPVFQVVNTNPATSGNDPWAIAGIADNYKDMGVGVYGQGGYQGVLGVANRNADWKMGVGAQASSTDLLGVNYGVQANASGANTNYGVYGSATGGNTNYGVYAYGTTYDLYTGGSKSYISGMLGIGLAPSYQVDVCGGTVNATYHRLNGSANFFGTGPGDGADKNTYNVNIRTWYGVGISNDCCGLVQPRAALWFNARTGAGYAAAGWNANQGDLAEWLNKDPAETLIPGSVVELSAQSDRVTAAGTPYSTKLVGIVTTKPGLSMGGDEEMASDTGKVQVGVTGRLPVIVVSRDAHIDPGTPITVSDIKGVAMKATVPGTIVGKTMQSTEHWNETNCPTVPSAAAIVWPKDDPEYLHPKQYTNPDGTKGVWQPGNGYSKDNLAKPCYRLPDGRYIGKLMAYAGVIYTDPLTTRLADQIILDTKNGQDAAVIDRQTGTPIDRIGAFAGMTVAKIQAGFIDTKRLVVDGVDVITSVRALEKRVADQQREIDNLKAELNSRTDK